MLEHIVPVNEHWKEYGPGAAGVGWDISLLRPAGHLAGQEMPSEEEWAATEAGQRFMTLSSGRWCDAGIAGGMDRDAALAAAERTTNAYTAPDADG